jgi:hypothetical protein
MEADRTALRRSVARGARYFVFTLNRQRGALAYDGQLYELERRAKENIFDAAARFLTIQEIFVRV